jgi:hypothetical protein
MTVVDPAIPGTRGPLVHEAIAATLSALESAGVAWCLLRGADELHLVDGDVDLLVSRSDLERLRRALVALGGPSPLASRGRQPHVFFKGPIGEGSAIVKLDVVSRLAFGPFGELPTEAAASVLDARRREGELWHPAPADAFWTLLCHVLLDRGRIRAERGRELQGLVPGARTGSSALADVVARACPAGWDVTRVLDSVEAGEWNELQALATQLRAQWPGTSNFSRRATVLLHKAQRKAGFLERRVRRGLQISGSIASKSRARSTG